MVVKITVRPAHVEEQLRQAPLTDGPDDGPPQPNFPATSGETAAEDGILPNELPSDDDDLEPALRRNAAEREQMSWFWKSVTALGQDPSSVIVSMAQADTLSGNKLAEREAERAKERKAWLDTVSKAASDFSRGVVEAPRQMIGGARDALQAAFEGLGAVGDWMNANVGDLGTLQLFDPQGGANIAGLPLLKPAIVPSAAQAEMPQLPEVKEATTVTGAAVRGVTQFLTGFVAAGKLLGVAAPASRVGQAALAATKGAISDFAAFDANEARLADLIQQVPVLQNPISEFLASDDDETELAGRFKRAVEGVGLGLTVEGLLLALRAIKAARAARAETPEEGARRAAATSAEPRETAALNLLGDAAEDAPMIARAMPGLGVPDDVAARALVGKGLTQLGAAGDGVYVNFARINSPEDVKRVIADTANAFKPEIEQAARGTRSNVQTMEEAAKLDAWDILAARRTGAPLNAEQSVAVRNLWAASGQKLLDVSELAARGPSPENLYQFRKMLATHYAIQQEVIAARTETARALQSWSIPAGGTREQMVAIEEAISKSGGLDVNAVFASRIAALRNVPNGLSALDEVVQKGVTAKTLDAIKEFWVMALLSGPKTHLVNTMSNAAVAGQQIIERFTASRVSQIVGSGEIPIGEAAAQWFGMTSAIRDAFRYAAKTFATGESGYGLTKLEQPFTRAISADAFQMKDGWMAKGVDAIGTVVNVPGRALLAEDEFFKTIGFRMELHAQAFRTASRDVLDGRITQAEMKGRIADIIANPPENLRLSAADAAAYQTFTTAPGTWVKAINRIEAEMMQNSVGGQIGAALMRFTIPFRNTPANIFKYAAERSPLAPLTQRYKEALAKGGADADIANTRLALGTMTMLLATDLAFDGHLTGSGPSKNERGERDALYRSGWQPYSVKVGNRYYAYNRMDPIGFTLGLGADMAEYVKDADYTESTGIEISKAMSAAVFSIGNNAINKNYMRGMAEFVNAVMEPDRQGPKWLERFVGSFSPTVLAETARAIDPWMRETGDIVSRLKSRTPGLSSDLPLMRDLWGRPKSYQSGLGQVYDTVSPIYSRVEDTQPIDREMFDIDEFINMPQTRGMDKAMRSRFLELQGQTKPSALGDKRLMERYGDQNLLDTLNMIVTDTHPMSAEYRKIDDAAEKKKFLQKIISAYRKAARNRITEEFKKPETPAED